MDKERSISNAMLAYTLLGFADQLVKSLLEWIGGFSHGLTRRNETT